MEDFQLAARELVSGLSKVLLGILPPSVVDVSGVHFVSVFSLLVTCHSTGS